jgi:hypothetical protein
MAGRSKDAVEIAVHPRPPEDRDHEAIENPRGSAGQTRAMPRAENRSTTVKSNPIAGISPTTDQTIQTEKASKLGIEIQRLRVVIYLPSTPKKLGSSGASLQVHIA